MGPNFFDFFKSFYYLNSFVAPIDLSEEALSEHLMEKENPEIAKIAQRLISQHDVQKALSDSSPSTQTETNQRKAILKKHGFTLLSSEPKIIEHKDLPGWIIKSAANAYPKERYVRGPQNHLGEAAIPKKEEGLFRLEMARRMALIAKEENIEVIIPKKKLVCYANAENITDPLKKYCVLSEKLDVLSAEETYQAIKGMDAARQKELAKKISIFVQKTGWIDPAVRNLRLTKEGKIALFDTEPYGLMVAKKPGFYYWLFPPQGSSIEKCARIGLFNLLQNVTQAKSTNILENPSVPGLEEFHKQIKSDYEKVSSPEISYGKIACSAASLGLIPLVQSISAFFLARFAKKTSDELDLAYERYNKGLKKYVEECNLALENQGFAKEYYKKVLSTAPSYRRCINGVPVFPKI